MSVHKNHKGKDRSSFQIVETDINPEVTLTDISQQSTSPNNGQSEPTPNEAERSVFPEPETQELSDAHSKSTQEKEGELISSETESLNKTQEKSIFQRLKTRTVAILVGSAVMLPILAVGTATYYFGSQALNKQAILAKRIDNIGLTTAELAREEKLLAALLIGTGTIALLTGAIAAFGTKRLIGSISKRATEKTETEAEKEVDKEFIQNLSQSVPEKDLLKAIVEEARNYLNCDRVVVYSLNEDKYGVIVAESVALGYTQALGKRIEDPCFEARYLDKYRDGRVRAIDNIYEAEMTTCHLEQLEQLEVKANLVTPIINEGKLFGLLIAHQCSQSRHWQEAEIEFLHQLAKKVTLALDNDKLLNDLAHLQTLVEAERKWTARFTDAIQYLRQSIKQDDVLEIGVEEVRRVLECDRVVVYSLNQAQYGVVVAESVAPGYPRALNKTISDPCFEARYLDKYRDGRVRAIDNIYEAGMTRCYIEQLETLEVKANLVTPILNEGKLFGLLVAHQCSQPRNWQDYEIRWVTQIATQVGFALDNAKLLGRLKYEGLPTQLLNSFTLGIRGRLKESELLKNAVEQARKIIGLDRVIVYQFDADWNGTVVAESVVPGYPRALRSQIKDPCFARDYAEKYRQGRVCAIANIQQANLTECHLEQLESLAVKASLVAPILQDEGLFGLLIGHQCSQPRSWEQWELDLFVQLALQLELALDRVRLQAELNQARHSKNVADEQLEQQSHQQQGDELVRENQAALQNRHSAATNSFLEEIPEMSDEVTDVTNVSPAQLQQHPGHSETIGQQKNIQPNKSIATVRETIAEVTEKVKHLNQSHQNLYQMVSLVNEMKEQIEQERSQTSIVNEQTNQADRNSLMAIAKTVNPLSQRLAQETAKVESLMGEIALKANEVVDAVVIGETIDEPKPQLRFEPIKNPDSEVKAIAGQIVRGAKPAQSLMLMNQFVEEIAKLSEQISQQSIAVTNSFQKLAEFAQDKSYQTLERSDRSIQINQGEQSRF